MGMTAGTLGYLRQQWLQTSPKRRRSNSCELKYQPIFPITDTDVKPNVQIIFILFMLMTYFTGVVGRKQVT